MKVRYVKPRGQRLNCTSVKISGRRLPAYGSLSVINRYLWWCGQENKWLFHDDIPDTFCYSSHKNNIHSVKAAVAHIKRHNEIPKGTMFRLTSNFIGYDVIITK